MSIDAGSWTIDDSFEVAPLARSIRRMRRLAVRSADVAVRELDRQEAQSGGQDGADSPFLDHGDLIIELHQYDDLVSSEVSDASAQIRGDTKSAAEIEDRDA